MASSRNAAIAGVAAALLAGCGGSQPPIGAYGTSGTTPALSHDRIFRYTGGKQLFKVPAGVTHLTITAYGASGGPGFFTRSTYYSAAPGGKGGMVTATIPVTPGERLAIFVGGSGTRGGFNGGGGVTGCDGKGCYGVGGGASDVRQGGDGLPNRVVVAAGGGGGGGDGYFCNTSSCRSSASPVGGAGAAGGGRKGASGEAGHGTLNGTGGTGGRQRAGGKGGAGGSGSSCGGTFGALGAGGFGGPGRRSGCGGHGGGGGGGYYGGGGGGAGGFTSLYNYGAGGGGGGGSSFAESHARDVNMIEPANKDNGAILLLW